MKIKTWEEMEAKLELLAIELSALKADLKAPSPAPAELWVNVYPSSCQAHRSAENAHEMRNSHCAGTFRYVLAP